MCKGEHLRGFGIGHIHKDQRRILISERETTKLTNI
jgi:hypothetical protein